MSKKNQNIYSFNFDDSFAQELDDVALNKILPKELTNNPTNISNLSVEIQKKDDSIDLWNELIEIEEDDNFGHEFDSILTSPLANKIGKQQNEALLITNALNNSIKINPILTSDNISNLIKLGNLQQSIAVNNIMLTFETQNQLVQDTKEDGKYDKVERQLIREIKEQCDKLAEKTYELNTKINNGISYARIDKLEHRLQQLEEKHIAHIEPKTAARTKDKGLAIEETVPEYYTKDDLKDILLQLTKAHKAMNQLLKMPDVDKRCSILAKLCDSTSALAKRSIFLIPQTIVAIRSVVEYAILTVIVDSIRQGFSAAGATAQAIHEKVSKRTPQLDENSVVNSLSKPLLTLASSTLSISVGMLLGAITGVGHTMKAGARNVHHMPSGIKENYVKHSTNNGNPSTWKKRLSEIYKEYQTTRDTQHQNKVQKNAAEKIVKKIHPQINF